MSESAEPPGTGATRSSFAEGVRDISPVLIPTIPFGIVYGALAAQAGLSLTENLLMSGITFAGASQFVALELWAHPLPFWTILAAVFAVNLRHVLYSAAIGRKMTGWSPLARYGGLGLLTDPTFAFSEIHGGTRLSTAYYFGLSLPLYVNWVLSTVIGALFGNVIGEPERFGFDFVVTAYFLSLVASFRKRPNAAAVIAISAAASLAVNFAAGSPWHIGAGAAAGMALAATAASRNAPA